MIRPADLPPVIPVFPLAGALLLPRARLPLHIFEPRYLAMVEECLKTPTRLIGMAQPREQLGPEALQSIGCAGRLVSFSETGDGRYMITLAGISRFHLRDEVEGFTPWRRFAVDWSAFARDLAPAEPDPGFDRDTFLGHLARFFEARDMTADWDSLRGAEPELLINALSQLAPFSPEERQALLEAHDLPTRRATLETLIEFALRGNGEETLQ